MTSEQSRTDGFIAEYNSIRARYGLKFQATKNGLIIVDDDGGQSLVVISYTASQPAGLTVLDYTEE